MKRGFVFANEFQVGDDVTVGKSTRRIMLLDGKALLVPDRGVAQQPLEHWPVSPGSPTIIVRHKQGNLLDPAPDPYAPWRYARWAVVDTETTGLGEADRIVEIAIVWMRCGVVEEAWSSLVNPGMPIPIEATMVHGITDAMVADKPTMADLLPEIHRRLEGAVVTVGYNIYGFDEPVLIREGVTLPRPVIDALVMLRARGVSMIDGRPAKFWKSESEKKARPVDEGPKGPIQWRRVGRHSLERASRELNQADPEVGESSTLHRAAWDAILTGRVLWQLRDHLSAPPPQVDASLRDEGKRQAAETEAFLARMRELDATNAVKIEPIERIERALAELRESIELLEGFKLWQQGK